MSGITLHRSCEIGKRPEALQYDCGTDFYIAVSRWTEPGLIIETSKCPIRRGTLKHFPAFGLPRDNLT